MSLVVVQPVETMRDWARFYVEVCGWAVIPLWYLQGDGRCGCGDALCVRAGKHPWYGEDWDRPGVVADTGARVDFFWAEHPWNIGIVCDQSSWGAGVGGDLLVVHANGGAAVRQLGRLGEAVAGIVGLPKTLVANTPSGGQHVYFRLPREMAAAGGAVLADRFALDDFPGLSVLGRGGYVVAEPSVEVGGVWAFDPAHKSLAEAPVGLVAYLNDLELVSRFGDSLSQDSPWRRAVTRTDSDLGNGRRLVDGYGHKIRYSTGLGWGYWADRWIVGPRDSIAEKLVVESAKELPDVIDAEIRPLRDALAAAFAADDPEEIKRVSGAVKARESWKKQSASGAKIRECVGMASSDPRIMLEPSRWDADLHYFGVRNGVVDLRRGTLQPLMPGMLITKTSAVSFDVEARDARFESFLDFVTDGDRIYREWLQKAAGLTLTGESEQMFFMVYGPSGSGKSTWLDMMHSILGGYAVRLDAAAIAEKKGKSQSTNEESFGRAMLLGKRMVHVSELAENAELKSDFVKPLTGEGQITGRMPRGTEFEIPVTQKLWIGTNHKPFVKDDAIWRRVKVLPFENVPEVPDDSLRRWFSSVDGAAARAALAWMVRGAVAYYADRKFGACGPVDKYTTAYRHEEDLVLAFISGMYEEVEEGSAEEEPISMMDILTTYGAWATASGKPMLRADTLRRKLTDAGHAPSDVDGLVGGLRARGTVRTTALGPMHSV